MSGTCAEALIHKFGFQFNIQSEAEGFLRCIWVLWSNPGTTIDLILRHRQILHLKVSSSMYTRLKSAVYGSPNSTKQHELWQVIHNLAPSISINWVLLGDFNYILHLDNKCGGRPMTYN